MASLNILLAIFFLIPARCAAGNGVPRSCEDVLSHYSGTFFKEGVYTIDPDGAGGVGAFQVTCTTRDDLPGHGVTLVPHQGGIVPHSQYFKGPGAISRSAAFDYRLTEEQLESLTRISGKCRQFVRFSCFEASNFVLTPWWVSRQGWNMTNWGGAPTNSSKCACAMKNNCDRSYRKCNCQINDLVWRNDEGHLDDKRYLPVKKVHIRDLDDSNEEVYLMVKPMECYGALASGSPTEKCLCSLHAEAKGSTKAGPLLFQLPDLIYGQGYYDVWIDDGNQKRKVTDVYPQFFYTKIRRQILPSITVSPVTSPECTNVLQRCPVDCERLAKLTLATMRLTTNITNGGVQKPLGQVMCENVGVTIPPPGSRIVAFYKTAPACGSSGSSTHVFSDNPTICCNVFTLPFTNQAYNVFNEKCSPNMDISAIFG
ncbi:uncharacterized protein LOC106177114 [Lingula anatina]|uniref:Uncharacterized protein LOC106177114 n=1 Tax=Lingula anatina TaxID=7574 RepID=A0A1S3JYV7_LINAN|nr:uncharacterized protein LOC106177114 [Lingula anatina]|eukprot:XP_013415259.1 uncharacterized protein LOC106177114 [Lingula anatina]